MQYFITALAGCVLALILTPIVRFFALKYKIVDQPGGRRINLKPIPRLGGLAVVLAFWLVVIATAVLKPDWLHFSGQTFHGIDRNLFGVLLGSLILAITGAVDDIRGLSPVVKLVAHIAAAAARGRTTATRSRRTRAGSGGGGARRRRRRRQ